MAKDPLTGNDMESEAREVKQGVLQKARDWGSSFASLLHDNSLSPFLLATLIFPQHARPFQALPMLFPPLLLFSSYINLNGYKTDAAGISAAWSGLYLLLASRRRQRIIQKFGTRGILRGATMGLAAVNLVSGGLAWSFGEPGRADKWIGKDQGES